MDLDWIWTWAWQYVYMTLTEVLKIVIVWYFERRIFGRIWFPTHCPSLSWKTRLNLRQFFPTYLSWRIPAASWWTQHSWGSQTWTWARPWSAGPRGGPGDHGGQSGPLRWLRWFVREANQHDTVTITRNLNFMFLENTQVTCYYILIDTPWKMGSLPRKIITECCILNCYWKFTLIVNGSFQQVFFGSFI